MNLSPSKFDKNKQRKVYMKFLMVELGSSKLIIFLNLSLILFISCSLKFFLGSSLIFTWKIFRKIIFIIKILM